MSAILLKGAPVAKSINEETDRITSELKTNGITPRLAIVRAGDKPDDIYYENAAVKKAVSLGVDALRVTLDKDISQEELIKTVRELSEDDSVSGILIMRPLPKTIDDGAVSDVLSPEKDVDGITPHSLYGVFSGKEIGFAPCTARACMEILKYYGVEISGKKVAVIGRSLVIGRPVSMMLMQENATVTICHTKTKNVSEITKNADMIVSSAGVIGSLGADFVREGQTVIDVSMNSDVDGNMHGDADFDAVSEIVSAITPVPGGVGSVTTAILINNVVKAAQRKIK